MQYAIDLNKKLGAFPTPLVKATLIVLLIAALTMIQFYV